MFSMVDRPSKFFTRRSFHFAVLSAILCLVFLVLSQVSRTTTNRSIGDLVGFLITLFAVSVLAGFVLAILSLREQGSRKRNLSAGFNILLFLIFAAQIMYQIV